MGVIPEARILVAATTWRTPPLQSQTVGVEGNAHCLLGKAVSTGPKRDGNVCGNIYERNLGFTYTVESGSGRIFRLVEPGNATGCSKYSTTAKTEAYTLLVLLVVTTIITWLLAVSVLLLRPY